MRECGRCKKIKELFDFHKSSREKDGLKRDCKDCRNFEKKIYRVQNKEKNNEYSKKYYRTEKRQKYFKEYMDDYKKRNHKKLMNWANKRSKERQLEDIQYKLKVNLRKRLLRAIKIDQKSGSAIEDLGCTIQFFKNYLESKFKPGMSWENYGLYGWHIDHVIPLSKFNLQNREDFLKACHYTNLQPLWATDNLKKGDK